MTHAEHTPFDREIAAVTEWWRHAGVDTCFENEPVGWLTEKQAKENSRSGQTSIAQSSQETQTMPAQMLGGGKDNWPSQLEEFRSWFASDITRDLSLRDGIAPFGKAGANLMIVTVQPESADGSQILSNDPGMYFRGILAASAIAEDDIYFASVLPAAMPQPDWNDLNARGIGEIIRHHISIVRPKRIVALGSSILPLLGNNPAQGPAEIRQFEQDSHSTPLFAAWQINRLRERSAARKRFWKLWLDWIASDD